MTEDKLASLKQKVESIKKQEEPCPEGYKMVDGECVPMKEASKENPMANDKQPETVEKKPEATATPAPAVPSPPGGPEPDPKMKAEIETLRSSLKTQSDTLNMIAEKVSGLVLNAEVKGQAEVLSHMIEQNKALAEALTAAQPPAPVGRSPPQVLDGAAVDMTPGSSSTRGSIDDRAARFARQWGLQEQTQPEVEITPTKEEIDPVKAELSTLRTEFNAQTASIKSIADKLTGLVETLSRNPAQAASPSIPSEPVIPAVARDKKSISSERNDYFDWDRDVNHGKSIAERAQLLEDEWGGKEKV